MSSLPPLDEDLEMLLAPARDVPPVETAREARALEAVRGAVARGAAAPVPTDAPAVDPKVTLGHRLGPWQGLIGMAIGVVIGAAGATWLADEPATPAPSVVTTEAGEGEEAADVVEVVETDETVDAHDPVDAADIVDDRTPPAHVAEESLEPRRAREQPARQLTEPSEEPDSLLAERLLIDAAFAQVNRGQPTAALTTLDRHEAQFSGGQLVESREALRIRALHALGRDTEARAMLEGFERRFPSSLVLPTLRAQIDGPTP